MSDSERVPTEPRLRLIPNTKNTTIGDNIEAELARVPIGCQRVGPFGTTLREAKMAVLLAQGMDVVVAYKQAYVTKRRNTHREASDVAKRTPVIQYVTALRASKSRIDLHDGQVMRDFIAGKLHELASNGLKEADQLRALELMGKLEHVGAYRERSEAIVTKRDEETIKAELKQRLKALSGG